MIENILREGIKELGISLIEEQLEQFEKYYIYLEEEGLKFNLTRITGVDVVPLHFLDSLIGAKYLSFKKGDTLLDVGSGAGFPGVPLKIVHPEIKLHLMDSSLKRLNFLEKLALKLNLENVEFFHGRAEDYGQNEKFRQHYPWVVSRALASLPVLLELCLPFCCIGGFFCAYKGPEGIKEAEESAYALKTLGGHKPVIYNFTLPIKKAERNLLLFKKNAQEITKNYPRKAGIPAKRPLIK